MALIRRFYQSSKGKRAVVVNFDPVGMWACACSKQGLHYVGAKGNMVQNSRQDFSDIIFRMASDLASPPHKIYKKLYVRIAMQKKYILSRGFFSKRQQHRLDCKENASHSILLGILGNFSYISGWDRRVPMPYAIVGTNYHPCLIQERMTEIQG